MNMPEDFVRTKDELKSIIGMPLESQANKIIDHIDDHCKRWIERCPFIVMASASAEGAMDISPKGDPAGFVRVLDRHTLVIPDRPGNRRSDTFLNVLENPNVGIIFIVPRRGETLRVSGEARIVRDTSLLQTMAIQNKAPQLALLVRVNEAFFHCGKSMIRSRLWQPDAWPSIDGLPTYAQALADHANEPEEAMQEIVTRNERERLY